MIGFFFEKVGKWLVRHFIILAIVSLCIGFCISAMHTKPVPATAVQEAKKEPEPEVPRIPCTAPRFKVGDVIETVLSTDNDDPKAHWVGQISEVVPYISASNKYCTYKVIHYNYEHTQVDADYYEFEIRLK